MSASLRNGAPPPHMNLTDAGDAEADSMIGRFGRIAQKPWRAAVRFLALSLIVAAPGALAKPFPLDPGPSLDGDPTADDQPSPGPKNRSASISGHDSQTTKDGRLARERHVRLAWHAYLRLIARIALR